MVFRKGNTPWNKGLTKNIDSRLNYIRLTIFKKGDKVNLGRKQSDTHKRNLSESHKGIIPTKLFTKGEKPDYWNGFKKGHKFYGDSFAFKKGHVPYNKGLPKELQPNYGKHRTISEETREKLIKSHLGQKSWNKGTRGLLQLKHTEEWKIQNGIKQKGKKLSEDTIQKIINSNLGKKRSKETRLKRKVGQIEKWKDKEYRNNQLKRIFEGLNLRPTSYEKKISELCIENNLPFIYTGDGTFLIGHKNPDFVNELNRIVIEVYHTYFKERDFGSCEEYEKQRGEYFAKYGWNTIFIRTNEIENKDWKNICLNKISSMGVLI